MPIKKKKTLDAPRRLWVVIDALSGHPVSVHADPDEPLPLMDDETLYEYELRRQNG